MMYERQLRRARVGADIYYRCAGVVSDGDGGGIQCSRSPTWVAVVDGEARGYCLDCLRGVDTHLVYRMRDVDAILEVALAADLDALEGG